MLRKFIYFLSLSLILISCATIPPQVNEFKANPERIEEGSKTTIYWNVIGADEVSIEGIGSNLMLIGSKEIVLDQTTTFKMLAKKRDKVDKYQILKSAIINKQQIFADYNGYHREMCPHILGTKNGIIHCLFYQFGGQSSSGLVLPSSPKNWRCLEVDKLTNVVAVDGEWFTYDNYSSHTQDCIESIDVEVEIQIKK